MHRGPSLAWLFTAVVHVQRTDLGWDGMGWSAVIVALWVHSGTMKSTRKPVTNTQCLGTSVSGLEPKLEGFEGAVA